MALKPRPTVLLADDNLEILEHVAHLLEGADYEVLGAFPDGESLLQAFAAAKPDLVVLDISMGALSGLDVARRLAQMGHRAGIVFLTVHEEAELVCEAFAAGAAAYVVKSQLSSDLIDALRASLAGRIFVSPILQQA